MSPIRMNNQWNWLETINTTELIDGCEKLMVCAAKATVALIEVVDKGKKVAKAIENFPIWAQWLIAIGLSLFFIGIFGAVVTITIIKRRKRVQRLNENIYEDPNPSLDTPAPDNPASNYPASNNPASNNPASNNPASNNHASNNHASNNYASNNYASNNQTPDLKSSLNGSSEFNEYRPFNGPAANIVTSSTTTVPITDVYPTTDVKQTSSGKQTQIKLMDSKKQELTLTAREFFQLYYNNQIDYRQLQCIGKSLGLQGKLTGTKIELFNLIKEKLENKNFY